MWQELLTVAHFQITITSSPHPTLFRLFSPSSHHYSFSCLTANMSLLVIIGGEMNNGFLPSLVEQQEALNEALQNSIMLFPELGLKAQVFYSFISLLFTFVLFCYCLFYFSCHGFQTSPPQNNPCRFILPFSIASSGRRCCLATRHTFISNHPLSTQLSPTHPSSSQECRLPIHCATHGLSLCDRVAVCQSPNPLPAATLPTGPTHLSVCPHPRHVHAR